MCYVRAMSRAVRVVVCLSLALLVLLEATPTVAKIRIRGATRRCEIAASRHPITLIALPSERGASAADRAATERTPLVPLTLLAADPRLATLATRAATPDDRGIARSRAWLHAHRQRARAPDDPDPL